jgi:hypothetical protein
MFRIAVAELLRKQDFVMAGAVGNTASVPGDAGSVAYRMTTRQSSEDSTNPGSLGDFRYEFADSLIIGESCNFSSTEGDGWL